jgi:PAS domain S-box-containing protein
LRFVSHDRHANLRRREEQYRATIEQLPVGIADVDADHRFTRVNAKFRSMLGFIEGELIGKSVAELNHPDDLQRSESSNSSYFSARNAGLQAGEG